MKKFAKILSFILAIAMVFSSSTTAYASTKLKSKYSNKTYTHQSKFDGKDIVYGIDISQHNGDIDFNKVKSNGIEFVFVRVGYTGYTKDKLSLNYDSKFKTYIKDATQAGLKVGVYWYAQALNTTEATREAQKLLSAISGLNITMPVVYDYEFADLKVGRLDSAKLSKKKKTANALAFLNKVSENGYDACLYASENFLLTQLNANQIAKKYKIWLANYSSKTNYDGDYEFWQHSSTGRVKGMKGDVDINVWYKGEEVTDLNPEIYTGSPITPQPQVKIGSVTLQKDIDYSLVYSNNINIGIANVDVVGKGQYADLKIKHRFKILPKQVTNLNYISSSDSTLTFTWDAVEGVNEYVMTAYDVVNGNTYETTVVGSTTGSFDDLPSGISYSVTVEAKAYDSQGESFNGIASQPVEAQTTGTNASGLKLDKRTNTTLTLSWNKMIGIDSYNVYMFNNEYKEYELVENVNSSTNTLKVTNLQQGTSYSFRVTACSGDTEGEMSQTLRCVTSPKKVSTKSAKSRAKKRINYTWKRINCTGYQYQWSTSKNFKTNFKSKTSKNTSCTIKTAQSRKKYYVRVRAYKLDSKGDKVYGAWSNTKSVKVR